MPFMKTDDASKKSFSPKLVRDMFKLHVNAIEQCTLDTNAGKQLS